jgi:hypothetical protein
MTCSIVVSQAVKDKVRTVSSVLTFCIGTLEVKLRVRLEADIEPIIVC